MKLLREYIRILLKEDPMGFVQDLSAATKSGEFGENFLGGNPGKAGGRAIKKAFNANADHQWLSTLDTIHWGDFPHQFKTLVGRSKDELSATMYLPGENFYQSFESFSVGLWIKGRITLAANDHDKIWTGKYFNYMGSSGEETEAKQQHRKKSSGINKRPTVAKDFSRYGMLKKGNEYHEKMARNIPYVLDQSTWNPSADKKNEALVDNWKPLGIIAADDKVVDAVRYITAEQENPWEETIGVVKTTFEVAKAFGVPIYDLNKEIIWEDG